MAGFDGNVTAAVVSGAQAVDRAVLNIGMHLSSSPTFPERVRTYSSAAEAAADTLLGTEGTAAVNAHFAQDLHAPQIKIGRSGDTPAAQVDTVTVGGTPLENEVYNITVNGIVTEHVAGATPTVSSVYTALDTAVTAAIAAETITVAGADPDITFTADNLGEPFTVTVSVTAAPGQPAATGTLTLVHTTPNAGIGSDLDACLAEDDGWYGLTTYIHATPATNLINMEAASAWAQINKKIYLAQSLDATVLAGTAGNDLLVLAAKNNSRTAYAWHQSNSELLAVSTMAYKFQADPDVVSTNWAYVPVSGISLKDPRLTSTQWGFIESQLGNRFDTFGGNGKFGMGITTTDKNIDIIITEDWLEARLQESYIQVLSDFAARNQKIGLNDKEMQVFATAGQKILDQGVAAGHLNEGSTEITVQKRADMSAADITDRHVRVTASGIASGAAEKVTITMTLSLV
jgi:hypothetical protein